MTTILHLLSVFFLFSASAGYAQDNWTLKTPTTKPPALAGHAMAYIGDDKVLVFGGVAADNNVVDDTWVYDLSDNTWSLTNPSRRPPARLWHAMAYIGSDKVLLYGGSESLSEPYSWNVQTWIYDLSDDNWTLKSPATNPTEQEVPGMAYIGGDKVLLCGLEPSTGSSGMWLYDLNHDTWTLQQPATKPSWRLAAAMSSIGGDKVAMFGGNGSGPGDATWVYDLSDNAWTLKTPETEPSQRSYHTMASIGCDKVLIFGGYPYPLDETWVYDLSDDVWTLKHPSVNPSARGNHAMASIGDNQVLLFGGLRDDFLDDTWVYTAEQSLPYCVPNQKVYMCHNNNTICVDLNAVDSHLSHGDDMGPCSLDRPNYESTELPTGFSIGQNYPNPFNQLTTISYEISEDAAILLRVFSPNGRCVAELESGMRSPGRYTAVFDARALPGGSYLYRLQANGQIMTGVMTVVK